MLYKYKKRPQKLDGIIRLIHVKYSIYAKHPHEFSKFLIKEVGTFKDLSFKSTLQIRDQIMRQRPVILWIQKERCDYLQSIIIVGFNRRLFFYLDPLSKGGLKVITRKQLLKRWKRANYQGISC